MAAEFHGGRILAPVWVFGLAVLVGSLAHDGCGERVHVTRAPSRYLYQVDGLHAAPLEYFGDEFVGEYEEVEFLSNEEEPRTLAEILEAEQEFFDRVWYVRSIVHADAGNEEVPEDIRSGAVSARQRVEEKYGRDELWKPIGPGHDEAWEYGYINGKLATLRWVLGSEWDFLDT